MYVECNHIQCTALRSRTGDTGSVIWRSSVYFAEHMLKQLWGCVPARECLFSKGSLSGHKVLELGAGTGVLPTCLLADARWVVPASMPLQWIATDRGENIPLMEKNFSRSVKKQSQIHLSACELDWLQLHQFGNDDRSQRYKASYVRDVLGSSSHDSTVTYPDLIICIDCVYNPALHAPLIATLDAFCEPGKTVILIVIKLRDVDNTRSFLQAWTEQVQHEIYHLEAELLPTTMQRGYAAWLAWRS